MFGVLIEIGFDFDDVDGVDWFLYVVMLFIRMRVRVEDVRCMVIFL